MQSIRLPCTRMHMHCSAHLRVGSAERSRPEAAGYRSAHPPRTAEGKFAGHNRGHRRWRRQGRELCIPCRPKDAQTSVPPLDEQNVLTNERRLLCGTIPTFIYPPHCNQSDRKRLLVKRFHKRGDEKRSVVIGPPAAFSTRRVHRAR
jgi:hypothetical protein